LKRNNNNNKIVRESLNLDYCKESAQIMCCGSLQKLNLIWWI